MRRTIEYHTPDASEPLRDADGEELPLVSWVVAVSDDYEDEAVRIVLTLEELGRAGYGLSAHMSPEVARRLRAMLRNALKEVGEPVGD